MLRWYSKRRYDLKLAFVRIIISHIALKYEISRFEPAKVRLNTFCSKS